MTILKWGEEKDRLKWLIDAWMDVWMNEWMNVQTYKWNLLIKSEQIIKMKEERKWQKKKEKKKEQEMHDKG